MGCYNMKIEEMQEPIFNIQTQLGELPKQHYFFMLFCRFDGTVEEFKKGMKGKRKGDLFQNIELEYDPYKPKTFSNLCTENCWRDRKKEWQIFRHNQIFEELDAIEDKRKVERYKLKENIEYEALDDLETKVKYDDRLTGGQFRDYTIGIRNLQDSRNIDREKPTNYSDSKINVDADVKRENNSELKLKKIEAMQKRMDEMEYD